MTATRLRLYLKDGHSFGKFWMDVYLIKKQVSLFQISPVVNYLESCRESITIIDIKGH